MTTGDGLGQPPSAEKSLGEIVGDVSEKAALLVREEIELAKTEVAEKTKSLVKGAVVAGIAGFFALLGLIVGLHGVAWLIDDALNTSVAWPGFLIVTGGAFGIALVAALLGFRWIKRGAPPKPDMAIEEARRTRELLESER